MMERLRKEILDTIGDRRPTYDDIRSMKYLHANIKGNHDSFVNSRN